MMTPKQLAHLYAQPWFEKFCANIIKKGTTKCFEDVKLHDYPVEDLISHCFVWSSTPEGHNYWNDISGEWRKYIKESDFTEVTLEEIAEKFGVPVEKLRIKD